jgi:hypothetical protein
MAPYFGAGEYEMSLFDFAGAFAPWPYSEFP